MKKAILTIIVLLILLMGGFMGYMYLTQPVLEPVPPVPPAASSSIEGQTQQVQSAAIVTPKGVTNPTDVAATVARDRLMIKVAGNETGTIEIELFNDIAPHHVARIEALARAGAYDNVVFHRVIAGFMAQTGDVEYGKRGGALGRAGTGSSTQPNLKAEFSDIAFRKGVVGMARGSDLNSANSQFFIMFDNAPFLDGKYTVVGRVLSGQNIVEGIKKGDPNLNGTVTSPDYMKKVTVIAAN